MNDMAISPIEELIWEAYNAVKKARLYVQENEPSSLSLGCLQEAESAVWDSLPSTYVW